MSAIVETFHLSRWYGKTQALEDLTLSIPEGAIYGFIGPNGAGKTTTMRILTTLLRPSSGDGTVAGYSVVRQPFEVRRMVGWMPDNFGVYETMRAWEYLDFFARSYSVPAERRSLQIEELLGLVDLSHKRDSYVMGLSRGMKQRLSLARTLVHDPPLLILDEPASGLDPRARIELRELLRELSHMGKTIMISSHILTELAEMCTHIGIIEQGRLLASGEVGTILHELQPHKLLDVRLLAQAEPALELLRSLPGVKEATLQELPAELAAAGVAAIQVDYRGSLQELSELLKALVAAGLPVISFAERTTNLEDVFMQITKGVVT